MSKHSPAPWIIKDSADEQNYDILQKDDHPTHGPYWVLATVNKCMGSESTANARLIATSPELLAASKALLALKPSGNLTVWDNLAAAVAKAEGK